MVFAKHVAPANRKRSLDEGGSEEEKEEHKQEFAQKDIDSFNKKYRATLPKRCNTERRCKGEDTPTFTPHWCSEENASATLLAKRLVSKLHKSIAKDRGHDFLYHATLCEECCDDNNRRRAAAEERKKGKRENGESVCKICPETDPSKFKTPSATKCAVCEKKSSKRKGDYTMRMRKAAEAGTMYCCVCRTYQAKDLFYRRYRHTVHHTIVKCDTKTCGPCLDTMYVSNKESLAVYRKEKIKEKILGLVTQSPRCVSCR
jgi:hypothetical protein